MSEPEAPTLQRVGALSARVLVLFLSVPFGTEPLLVNTESKTETETETETEVFGALLAAWHPLSVHLFLSCLETECLCFSSCRHGPKQ